jgi:hypothetical protein
MRLLSLSLADDDDGVDDMVWREVTAGRSQRRRRHFWLIFGSFLPLG